MQPWAKPLLRLNRAKEHLKSVEERIFARANDKDRDEALKELKNAESLCRKYGPPLSVRALARTARRNDF